MNATCPFPECGRPLQGLGSFCHACRRYASDYRPEPTVPADTRSDAEKEAEGQLNILGGA